ncbi:MAG: hypothetical protein ABI794_07500 [Betaproteobacteria bacterium]
MVTQAQVVFVNSRSHLIDSTGHHRRYVSAAGLPICPGYWYVVSWHGDVTEPRFDAQAHYAGPHASEQAARLERDRIAGVSGLTGTISMATEPPAPGLGDVGYSPDWRGGL